MTFVARCAIGFKGSNHGMQPTAFGRG